MLKKEGRCAGRCARAASTWKGREQLSLRRAQRGGLVASEPGSWVCASTHLLAALRGADWTGAGCSQIPPRGCCRSPGRRGLGCFLPRSSVFLSASRRAATSGPHHIRAPQHPGPATFGSHPAKGAGVSGRGDPVLALSLC